MKVENSSKFHPRHLIKTATIRLHNPQISFRPLKEARIYRKKWKATTGEMVQVRPYLGENLEDSEQ